MDDDPTLCARLGCGKKARWMPVLTFTALNDPFGARARAEVNAGVCDGHRTEADQKVLVDALWPVVVARMVAKGRAEPDKDSVIVEYE